MAGFGLKSRSIMLAVSNTAQAVEPDTSAVYRYLQDFIIKAREDNDGVIYIGDENVNGDGFSLLPGATVTGALLRVALSHNDAGNWDMSKIFAYGTSADILEILHAKKISVGAG